MLFGTTTGSSGMSGIDASVTNGAGNEKFPSPISFISCIITEYVIWVKTIL